MATANEAKLWFWRDYSRRYLDREQTNTLQERRKKDAKTNLLEQSGRYSPMNFGLNG